MSSLKALKTLTLGKNKLKKMPDKELQGDSAFDTTWMLTPREITPRVDLKKFPEVRRINPYEKCKGPFVPTCL